MNRYQLLADGYIRRDDGASIPPDPENVDYQEYLLWVSAGNVPDPYTPPARVDIPTIQEQLNAVFKGGADFEAMKLRVLAAQAIGDVLSRP